jgi:hypothetical protein
MYESIQKRTDLFGWLGRGFLFVRVIEDDVHRLHSPPRRFTSCGELADKMWPDPLNKMLQLLVRSDQNTILDAFGIETIAELDVGGMILKLLSHNIEKSRESER